MSYAGLALALLLTVSGIARADSRCLSCHPVHYRERGGCTTCHRGDPAAQREALAHHDLIRGAAACWNLPSSPVLVRAAAMRDSLGCRRCHLTGGRGERQAIPLDAVVRERGQDRLRQALLDPAGAMPRFDLTETQADTLIALLLHDGDPDPGHERYQVRFQGTAPDTLPVFTRLCGDCHRALGRTGPLGSGSDGPDLSGLTGEFYPALPPNAGTPPAWPAGWPTPVP